MVRSCTASQPLRRKTQHRCAVFSPRFRRGKWRISDGDFMRV